MSVSRWRRQYRSYLKATGSKESTLSFSKFIARKKTARLKRIATNTGSGHAIARRLSRRTTSKIQKTIWNGSGKRRKILTDVGILTYQSKPNALRDTLCPNYEKLWRSLPARLRDRSVTQIGLTNFSLAHDPGGVLHQLREIAAACAKCPDIRLNFEDQEVEDVGAYILLAHLLESLPPVIRGGRIWSQVGRVLQAVGMARQLGIGRFRGKRNSRAILPFKMVQRLPPAKFRDPSRQLKPQRKERVADEFCNTLSEWLHRHGLMLTGLGEANLTASIGEALDNAERHGLISEEGSKGDWTIAGFSRIAVEDGKVLVHCSVSMVNIGETISSSLATASPEVAEQVDTYVQKHSGKADSQTIERLRTVMAVQDGITRVKDASQHGRGGVGLLELASLFAALGDNAEPEAAPRFTIISGNACLRITAPYSRGMRKEGSYKRELWFNAANDPKERPVDSHVFSLRERFAGTVLSACFTIDPTHMKKRLGHDSDNGSQNRPD